MRNYLEYLKNNPNRYWFRARWYGWGWTPATWEGLLILIAYIAVIIFSSASTTEDLPSDQYFSRIVLPLLVPTFILILVCMKKGERPRWNRGDPRKRKADT